MKKYFVAGGLLVVFGLYIISSNQNSSSVTGVTGSPTSPTMPPPATTAAGGSTPGNTANGIYKDGTYTGSVADAYYGNLQVAAVIKGGKFADVQFLQYPSDRGRSIQVNNYSNPILKQEAIQAQSANVNIVSGATDSSMAFQQSLADALAQAKI